MVLDPGEMSTFEDSGFVKLEAVVNRDRLAGLAAAAWMALGAQFGISDDRTTWPFGARKTVRRAVRDDPAFVELGTSTITVLVDRVLGAGSWAPPRHWGATMEVVFPALDAGPWRLPTTPWHLDFPFDMHVDRVGGLKVVVLLDEVAPDGGATLVVARSHHAIARFVRTAADCSDHSGTQKAFLKSAPWLRQLTGDRDDLSRTATFMDAEGDIDGTAVWVTTLSGSPGDTFLMHPWLVHCPSPNTSPRPRLAYGQNFYRLEVSIPDP